MDSQEPEQFGSESQDSTAQPTEEQAPSEVDLTRDEEIVSNPDSEVAQPDSEEAQADSEAAQVVFRA